MTRPTVRPSREGRALVAVVVVAGLLLGSCGNTAGLGDDERDWCTLRDGTEQTAARFDLIFEAGLNLDLNMDVVNALASRLRTEYQDAGMSLDDAVRAVSDQLLENPDYVAACREAYATFGPGAAG